MCVVRNIVFRPYDNRTAFNVFVVTSNNTIKKNIVVGRSDTIRPVVIYSIIIDADKSRLDWKIYINEYKLDKQTVVGQ